MEKLKSHILGGSDIAIQTIEKMKSTDKDFNSAIEKKLFDSVTPLKLIHWDNFDFFDQFLLALTFNYHCEITHVNLTNSKVGDLSLMPLLHRCTGVQSLNLTKCSHITDNLLKHIAHNLKSLRFLDLTKCVKITDFGLHYLANRATNLEELILNGSIKITSVGVKNIVEKCKSIKAIRVVGAAKISADIFPILQRKNIAF